MSSENCRIVQGVYGAFGRIRGSKVARIREFHNTAERAAAFRG